MPGTYTQVYIQIVFAVKGRANLINDKIKKDVHCYITGIINGKKQKPIIVNGMPDHVHIFVELKPSMSISDLVRDIKCNSSKFINEQQLTKNKFEWQNGYGAFSYSKSQIDRVYKYIQNQEAHHYKKTFKEEYIEFLNAFEIEFDEKYLFEFYD